MLTRSLIVLIACLGFAAVSCSGGKSEASEVQPGCVSSSGSSEGLCLVSCNLGCSAIGCSITDIAENQPIILVFNQAVDPASVSNASVSLRTATGEEPVGRLLTSGSTVTFVPEILIVGTSSFLGFKANENYTLTIKGGPNELNALRSADGDVFASTVSCNLAVTRGIVDLDGKPPTAKLVSPADSTNVDPATTIVVEFSEIIDITSFLSASPGNEPVRVGVSQPRAGSGGGLECNPSSVSANAAGRWDVFNDVVRQATVATFFPAVPLPAAGCITVEVTSQIRDLSGKAGPTQFFRYVTSGSSGAVTDIVEDFSTEDQFDADLSSGTWMGGLEPGPMGGDGLHGEFDPTIGRNLGNNVFEWSTDNQSIPGGSRTLTGNTEVVTDGVFRFSNFVVPSGVTVRFVGRNPARIFVRGNAQLDGIVDVSGADPTEHQGTARFGQVGSAGGAGGGTGGNGAEPGDGMAALPEFGGQPGEDVRVIAGHAFESMTMDTGGRGSAQYPASGLNSDITTFYRGFFSSQVAAGGGGGGNVFAGQPGMAIESASDELGPDSPAGIKFGLFDATGTPSPVPPGTSVLDHLLVGGAGGGGSGSHPFLETPLRPQEPPVWYSGSGGAGGGGALGMRIGRDLTMTDGGVVAQGGSTVDSSKGNFAIPGGAGAGGSIILQVAGVPDPGSGGLDVTGGQGGSMTEIRGTQTVGSTQGGDGSDGYYRVEAPGPLPTNPGTGMVDPGAWVGSSLPAPQRSNVSELDPADTDPVVGIQSTWYRTQQLFPPQWIRYELVADIDGVEVTYSDDPSVGMAAIGSSPIQLYVQGASPDLTGVIVPANIKPWRQFVGRYAPGQAVLDDDAATVFRFLVLFDRTLFTTAKVKRLTVVLRPFS